jgi:RecA-family ATPase
MLDDVWDAYARGTGGGKAEPGAKSSQEPAKFDVVDPTNLQGKWIPPREWVVEDWLPIGTVTALYGDGGTGKTLLAQQLMTAAATGSPWCGRDVMKCRSFALFAEDDGGELHRRQDQINRAMGCKFSDLGYMRWVSGVGADNTFLNFDAFGMIEKPRLAQVADAAKAFGARLLVLDTAADLFAGNENDRHQVRQFIGVLTKIAIEIGGAVLLNAHPSRTGLSNGNFDGGSTAWSNSVRSRWSLARPDAVNGEQEDTDARVLTRRKANYARAGEDIRLQWVDGALLPRVAGGGDLSGADRAAAETVFLELLASRWKQGMAVSHSSRSGNHAPRVFGRCAERRGYSQKDFEAAMGRLFDARRIAAVPYGRPGDARQRIAAVTEQQEVDDAT